MGTRRWGRVAVLMSLLALALLRAGTATAQVPVPAPGATGLQLCTDAGIPAIPEIGPRTCTSIEAGSTLVAELCAHVAPPGACAQLSDGRTIDSALVDAFTKSWAGQALRLQDHLDDDQPLRNVLIASTHNSFNSGVYDPSVTNLDPNQRYSLTDQLRMGIRGIELDLHPENGHVVLCHGQPVDIGGAVVHAGCSIDRAFAAGLQELRDFLGAPGNEHEQVLLYLENNLDGVEAYHDEAAATIDAVLGDLVERPPAGSTCASMPLDTTQAAMAANGHRVLIVGNCGPGAWGSWVFERGPDWDESGSGSGYPDVPACIDAHRVPSSYDAKLIRIYEDSTWLSAMASGTYEPLTATDIHAMVDCGVDLIGLDRVVPDDGRLEALIWSWAPDEPSAAGACVAWGPGDARFRSAPCDDEHGYACRTTTGDWVVPAVRGPRSGAEAACATVDALAATPPTGWEDERLLAAAGAAGQPDLWLSIASPPPITPGDAAVAAATLPATGGPAWELPIGALLALAAGARVLVRRPAR